MNSIFAAPPITAYRHMLSLNAENTSWPTVFSRKLRSDIRIQATLARLPPSPALFGFPLGTTVSIKVFLTYEDDNTYISYNYRDWKKKCQGYFYIYPQVYPQGVFPHKKDGYRLIFMKFDTRSTRFHPLVLIYLSLLVFISVPLNAPYELFCRFPSLKPLSLILFLCITFHYFYVL